MDNQNIRVKCITEKLLAGDQSVNLTASDALSRHHIVGVAIRANEADGNRKSVNNTTLLSEADMQGGHLTFSIGEKIIDRIPLELISIDARGDINDYFKVNFPKGFDYSESKLEFAAALVANADLEIIYWYEGENPFC